MTFTCITSRGAEEWTVEVHSLLNAGWAGRRTEQVAAHARELQGLGVAPPSRVPITIPLARSLLTQGPEVEVYSPGSSGEVEYVLVVTGGRIGLTAGSDHTDREAERVSVEWSKRLYPNVVAPIVWDLADVAAHVDDLRLRAWVRRGGSGLPTRTRRSATSCPRPTGWTGSPAPHARLRPSFSSPARSRRSRGA